MNNRRLNAIAALGKRAEGANLGSDIIRSIV
jgi:hypothetical protein